MRHLDLYFFKKSKTEKKTNYVRTSKFGKIGILSLKREIADDDPELVLAARTQNSHLNKKEKCNVFANFELVNPEPLTKDDMNEIVSSFSDLSCCSEPATFQFNGATIVTDKSHMWCKIDGELVESKYTMVNDSGIALSFTNPLLYSFEKDISKCPMNLSDLALLSCPPIKSVYEHGRYRLIEVIDSVDPKDQKSTDVLYYMEMAYPTIHDDGLVRIDMTSICRGYVTKTADDVIFSAYFEDWKRFKLSEFNKVEELGSIAWRIGHFDGIESLSAKEVYESFELLNANEAIIKAINEGVITIGFFENVESLIAYVSNVTGFYELSDDAREDVLRFFYGTNRFEGDVYFDRIKRTIANLSLKPADAATSRIIRIHEAAKLFYQLYLD